MTRSTRTHSKITELRKMTFSKICLAYLIKAVVFYVLAH
jgi:hypothetical protein